MSKRTEILKKYLPESSIEFVIQKTNEHPIQLIFTTSRKTKRGDYRPPVKKNFHVITLSYDDNKYQMLLTFLHEYAHLLTWNKYGNKVAPHGKEWKRKFQEILLDSILARVFPENLRFAIFNQYLTKESFSVQHNTELDNILREYDPVKRLLVKDLDEGQKFELTNGMKFIKGEKLRKRFLCTEIDTKNTYTIHGFTEVYRIFD